MSKGYDQVLSELTEAVEQAVNDLADDSTDRQVVNKFVLVVDSTSMDSSQRQHHTLFDQGEAPWDIEGLLYRALKGVSEIQYTEDDYDDAGDDLE